MSECQKKKKKVGPIFSREKYDLTNTARAQTPRVNFSVMKKTFCAQQINNEWHKKNVYFGIIDVFDQLIKTGVNKDLTVDFFCLFVTIHVVFFTRCAMELFSTCVDSLWALHFPLLLLNCTLLCNSIPIKTNKWAIKSSSYTPKMLPFNFQLSVLHGHKW